MLINICRQLEKDETKDVTMSDKFKILQVMNGASLGGISTVMLNYYRNMNREKYTFELALYNSDLGYNGEQFVNLGCQVFFLPLKSKSMLIYIRTLWRILKNGNYNAIHVHSNRTSYVALMVAKFCGVNVRVAHAHTAQPPTTFKEKIKRVTSIWLTPLFATKLLACTNDAGCSIFGGSILKNDKYQVLHNAIEIRKFAYNKNIRNAVRKDLGLEDCIIIGNVGNLGPEKNQQYLLRIMAELCKNENRWHLLIIGAGELLDTLVNQTNFLGIQDHVTFLGQRSDVNELLQAMDVFIIPSFFEGFSLAGLEACISGLPVFLSDKIPRDLGCFKNAQYLSIEDEPSTWAKLIIQNPLAVVRDFGLDEALKNGFDIHDKARELEIIYRGADAKECE